jgi:hypothetical protein
VSYSQSLSSNTDNTDLKLGFFQPASAWMPIVALFFVTALGILVGAGKLVNLAFPVGSLLVGVFLYFRYPTFYLSFTWWMWFLTAFIRRLADYRSGYTEPSPLLLAPYLVTAVTLITVFQHLPKARREGGLAFAISLTGIFYGFLIGAVKTAPFEVARYFLDWLCPIAFGFHLFVNWRNFPSYYQNIQRTFFWGVLITGTYGVLQFLLGPQWDVDWLVNSGMTSSNGYADVAVPGALSIRVFSTMNSVEPFSAIIAGGLLLLFNNNNQTGILKVGASVSGYLALLLSMARSAWIGWFIGLIVLGSSLKSKYQMRLIVTVFLMALLVIPLATIEPFSTTIVSRTQSLTNVQEDNSFKGRNELLQSEISSGRAFTNFLGDGISSQGYDSGLLAAVHQLGWFGAICYGGGLISLILKLWQEGDAKLNILVGTFRAVAISCLVRVPANPSAIMGVGGILLWMFLGLNLAARKYHYHQQRIEANKTLSLSS